MPESASQPSSSPILLAEPAARPGPAPRRAVVQALRTSSQVLLVLWGALVLLAAACSSEEDAAQGGACRGAVVDGRCEVICDPARCAANHTCVQNDCRPNCENQEDCPLGYNCSQAVADDGKTQGAFCVRLPYAADGGTGQGVPCSSDENCDTQRGFSCRHGSCQIWGCTTHDDCGTYGACMSDGSPEKFCQRVEGDDYAPGHFNTRCPKGDECDKTAGFACRTAGEQDADAYCTKTGCSADADCAVGYTCMDVLIAGGPCQPACGLSASQDPDCVPADQIGKGEWSCGPPGLPALERKMCIKRAYCMTCEKDEDCGALPAQICATDSSDAGTKICTTLCDPDIIGACPWANASRCDVFDTELNQPTCAHRFGSCVGTGKPCEPCLEDEHCGASGYCIGFVSGEQACIDLSYDCNVDSDCPLSPGDLQVECGFLVPDTCDVAFSEFSLSRSKLGCWPK